MVFVVGAVRAGEAVVTQGGAKVVKGFGDGGGVGCGWPWHKKSRVRGEQTRGGREDCGSRGRGRQ